MRIATSPLRCVMIERDNLQPSYFWRNPALPQQKRVYIPLPGNMEAKTKFLTAGGWIEIKKLKLWRDPLNSQLLHINKAYYTELRRQS